MSWFKQVNHMLRRVDHVSKTLLKLTLLLKNFVMALTYRILFHTILYYFLLIASQLLAP